MCCSFSTAITPPIRTKLEPYGISNLNPKMAKKVSDGNKMALWSFKVVKLALILCVAVWFENPSSSKMFVLPEWLKLIEEHPRIKDLVGRLL